MIASAAPPAVTGLVMQRGNQTPLVGSGLAPAKADASVGPTSFAKCLPKIRKYGLAVQTSFFGLMRLLKGPQPATSAKKRLGNGKNFYFALPRSRIFPNRSGQFRR
ncbi:MAG TPA: hypothetical protein VMI06_06775 [Terriglobia bacterium]|nr:hypothetical protein [Terriglobia bacterium]